jgi:uncharacterized protein
VQLSNIAMLIEKTAHNLGREKRREYHPDKNFAALRVDRMHQIDRKWIKAWALARLAAKILKQKFGAQKVVVFGSLLEKDNFSPWSDIDLAVWGISGSRFYAAVGTITGLSPFIKIDLVDPDTCNKAILETILNEGKEL